MDRPPLLLLATAATLLPIPSHAFQSCKDTIFITSSELLSLQGISSNTSPAKHFIKHLMSLLTWPSLSPPTTTVADVVVFKSGYLVQTLVEGSNNNLGVVPHTIRIAPEGGDLFAVNAASINIVRITPPLSHYSCAHLVVGSFQGFPSHVESMPSDARFNRPRGVAMDGRRNVYVADTDNLAVPKIGEAGVTTIAATGNRVCLDTKTGLARMQSFIVILMWCMLRVCARCWLSIGGMPLYDRFRNRKSPI